MQVGIFRNGVCLNVIEATDIATAQEVPANAGATIVQRTDTVVFGPDWTTADFVTFTPPAP